MPVSTHLPLSFSFSVFDLLRDTAIPKPLMPPHKPTSSSDASVYKAADSLQKSTGKQVGTWLQL